MTGKFINIEVNQAKSNQFYKQSQYAADAIQDLMYGSTEAFQAVRV